MTIENSPAIEFYPENEPIIQEALYSDDQPIGDLTDRIEMEGHRFVGELCNRLPKLADQLCFVDVIFIVPELVQGGSRSRGFVACWEESACIVYNRLLDDLIRDGYDVAGHPVFSAGLPRFTKPQAGGESSQSVEQPETEYDLSALWGVDAVSGDPGRGYLRHAWSTTCAASSVSSRGTRPELKVKAWDLERSDARSGYGDTGRSIRTNFAEYSSRLRKMGDAFADSQGRRVALVLAIPISYWIRRLDGTLQAYSGGSVFLGTSSPPLPDNLSGLIALAKDTCGAGYLVRHMERLGERQQKISFAHQTSSVIDTIVESVRRLPTPVRAEMGGGLIAKLHLLRTTINSYRSRSSRVDAGNFPFPWETVESPLHAYRDLGIELGLARAQEATEDEPPGVQDTGLLALLPEYQPGQPKFEIFRGMFRELPSIESEVVKERLKHSSFAVLILLALKQAVYHTVRARERDQTGATISITLGQAHEDLVFECTVENAKVTDNDRHLTSKDCRELSELAAQLSDIPGHPCKYSVEGPRFHHATEAWRTVTRIHSYI